MNDQDNAPATLASGSHGGATEPKDPYAIREEYALAERSTKIIARLNIVFGGLGVIIGLVGLIGSVGDTGDAVATRVGMAVLFLLCGSAVLWVGIELVMLKPWARIVMAILYLPNLLLVPIGTIIGGCIIWALLNKKAAFVCSEEYHRIVAATPDYKWNWRADTTPAGKAQQSEEPMKRAA